MIQKIKSADMGNKTVLSDPVINHDMKISFLVNIHLELVSRHGSLLYTYMCIVQI